MKYFIMFMFILIANESYADGYKLWQDPASGRWNYKCTGGRTYGHDSESNFTKDSYARENAEKFCLGREFNSGGGNFKSFKDLNIKNSKNNSN